MGDFTIEDLVALWDEGDSYRDILQSIKIAEANFGWWCLGHNFDVVATILTMSSLSWQKGWDARDTINSVVENARTSGFSPAEITDILYTIADNS